jgi:drug/metabolite transporter (DMT)-like permease
MYNIMGNKILFVGSVSLSVVGVLVLFIGALYREKRVIFNGAALVLGAVLFLAGGIILSPKKAASEPLSQFVQAHQPDRRTVSG